MSESSESKSTKEEIDAKETQTTPAVDDVDGKEVSGLEVQVTYGA